MGVSIDCLEQAFESQARELGFTRFQGDTLSMMGRVCETIGGLWELFRLGALTRFRFSGAYWHWRLHTAFGRGYPATKAELVRSVLAYGIWMRRMRRG